MNKIINKKICCFPASIGGIPKTYLESLSYEEQLLWFCKNLKNLIENANNQNDSINEATQYMKDNIEETTINVINELIQEEKIYVNLKISYDEINEELTIGGDLSNE